MPLCRRDPALNDYVEALYELKKHVEENSDYVGDKFSDEARKIHYGEEEPVRSMVKPRPRKPKSSWKRHTISTFLAEARRMIKGMRLQTPHPHPHSNHSRDEPAVG